MLQIGCTEEKQRAWYSCRI